jgi:hypothetical protein
MFYFWGPQVAARRQLTRIPCGPGPCSFSPVFVIVIPDGQMTHMFWEVETTKWQGLRRSWKLLKQTHPAGVQCGKLFCTPFKGQQFRRRRAAWTIWTEARSQQGISCYSRGFYSSQKDPLFFFISDTLVLRAADRHTFCDTVLSHVSIAFCVAQSLLAQSLRIDFSWGMQMLRRHEWKSLCLHPHMPFLSIPCFNSFRHQSHDEPWCFSTLITFAPRDDSSQGARKHLQNWSTAREASLWGVAKIVCLGQNGGPQNAMGLQLLWPLFSTKQKKHLWLQEL